MTYLHEEQPQSVSATTPEGGPTEQAKHESSIADPSSPPGRPRYAVSVTTTSDDATVDQRTSTVTTNDVRTRRDDGIAEGNVAQLLVCTFGICACFMYYAVLHEQLFTSPFMRGAGHITSFVIVTQSFTNTLLAFALVKLRTRREEASSNKKKEETTLNHGLFVLAALCYSVAMTATNHSLNYVSYPTATLAKSSKLIPTMLTGVLVERKRYDRREWLGVLLITAGVVIFNLTRMRKHDDGSSSRQRDSPYGVLLLALSLVADGLLSACQGMLKDSVGLGLNALSFRAERRNVRSPTAIETMLLINLYSIFFLLPTAVLSGQLSNATRLLFDASNATAFVGAIVGLNLCAASGQLFIFHTITVFSSLVCTTITTTRKFFTILLSVARFGHVFDRAQWTSIFMVFGGLYLNVVPKLRGDARGVEKKRTENGVARERKKNE